MKPEALIKSKIRDWLKSIGAYVFSPVQMGLGEDTVDILVCFKGWFVAIEVKVPGKKPTKRQELRLVEIAQAGGVAFWCTSLESAQENFRYRGLL